MEPHHSAFSAASSGTSSSSSCTSKVPPPPPGLPETDDLLAGADYKVSSFGLLQVARRLETVDVSGLSLDAVHRNPSDIGSWVDSILTELSESNNLDNVLIPLPTVNPAPLDSTDGAWIQNETPNVPALLAQQEQQKQVTLDTAMEEDSGIRLVHTLISCAGSVQRGELALAGSLIGDMQSLLTRVNTGCGIGKVASYFIDALSRRIFGPQVSAATSPYEAEILYHHYYEACPYLKFAHFTANQAILEAFDGHDCVHVVDFNLMHGLQWPAMIQALALRPGGPPLLRLTGVGSPSPDGRDTLREIGLRLAELARSVNVRFAFRGVAASRLEDVKPWMLQVSPKEAVAFNSIMQLHRLLGPDPNQSSAIEMVLGWIRSLNPKIMTVVEQEANHNQPRFLDRFTESLYYYSTILDSLEASPFKPEKILAEIYIQREIHNVVCCEGPARVERHEPLQNWKTRLERAGFKSVHLGSNAFKLLTLFSSDGYCVDETDGCLTLGWHHRPLVAASAWQASSRFGVLDQTSSKWLL